MRIFAAKNNITMETVTLTFSPNIPFAARIDAFLKTVPPGVKVSKIVKPRRKRKTEKERFLAELTKAGQQALDIAKKNPEGYTADELIASIFDD